MRAVIAMMKDETNTVSPVPTPLAPRQPRRRLVRQFGRGRLFGDSKAASRRPHPALSRTGEGIARLGEEMD
jgi:hypothetical protein